MTRPASKVARTLLLLLVVATTVASVNQPQPSANASEGNTDSAVTVSGKGDFAGLQVIISQTKNLINQVVRISWSGGTATRPSSGAYATHYLQIMQCWGDAPAGPGQPWLPPTREQCQFGATPFRQDAGAFVGTRKVNYGGSLKDAAETTYLPPPAAPTADVQVPFKSVTGLVVPTAPNQFFDQNTTNEIALARTRVDGTGEQFFELHTKDQAPGLGCGERLTGDDGSLQGRRCWLVIVPRADREVDGSPRDGTNTTSGMLRSSPLTTTNWAHRLVVPLEFEPVGRACPIGTAERAISGHEVVGEAISRWQSALCADGGQVFGFSRVTDSLARGQIASATPGLTILSRPVPEDEVPASAPPVYAPLAISGLAVAFNVESQAAFDADPPVKQRDGQRITQMKLNARLIAKLLTQSYRFSVGTSGAAHVQSNPRDLTQDPEFVALNGRDDKQPFWQQFFPNAVPDALVALENADLTAVLWSWIDGDPEARTFLNGAPDEWGMKVNPEYQGDSLPLPLDIFPKQDPFCVTQHDPALPDLCTIDAHPYASDLTDAGRSASRGDNLARTAADLTNPLGPRWGKQPPQVSGQRSILAIVDTAAAARFGLPTAQLQNAAGAFVSPTTDSLLAAVGAMPEGQVEGVLDPVPRTETSDAYPLTNVSYAVTAPAVLDADARTDYATFLRYAAGPGQQLGVKPGELPEGYAPLPQALRDQTLVAADAIENYTPPPPTPAPGGSGGGDGGSAVADGGDGAGDGGSPSGIGPSSPVAAGPPATATPQAEALDAMPPAELSARTLRTPDDRVGRARFVLLASLTLGASAALAGPSLRRVARGRRR